MYNLYNYFIECIKYYINIIYTYNVHVIIPAQCGKPVKAVPVSSPDELHTGDHILYKDTYSRDGYRSALVASEPEHGRFRVITTVVRNPASGEALQFSSLPRLHKVQYTPCQYSGEEAVQRARSGPPRYSNIHELVSLAKTGVKHSLDTIIEELEGVCCILFEEMM